MRTPRLKSMDRTCRPDDALRRLPQGRRLVLEPPELERGIEGRIVLGLVEESPGPVADARAN